jgi:hypothetical protein
MIKLRRKLGMVLACALACGGESLVVSDDLDGLDVGPPGSGDAAGSGGRSFLAGYGYGYSAGTGGGGGTFNANPGVPAASGAAGDAACYSIAEQRREIDKGYGPSSVIARHVGRWSGFITSPFDPIFPSDVVSLEISPDGTGALVFGENAPPPPPSSANEGYLCGPREPPYMTPSPADRCASAGFVEGIAYELREIRSDGVRLQLSALRREPWNTWCALQTPRPFVRGPDYDDPLEPCLFGIGPDQTEYTHTAQGCSVIAIDGTETPIDCSYLNMLFSIQCSCQADGCLFDGGPSKVDMALFDDDRAMIGSIDGATIQFRRDEPAPSP